MKELFEEGSGWGNYAIRGIVEIELPQAVALSPQTPGWWVLSACFLLWLGYRMYKRLQRYWRNRYRRVAIAKLKYLQRQFVNGDETVLQQVPELLKATALQAYPRRDVASLYGEEWELFLDSCYQGSAFSKEFTGSLSSLSYRSLQQPHDPASEQFWSQIKLWIKNHREEGSYQKVSSERSVM